MPTHSDDDDDLMLGAVPEPDDEPTAAERAHARTFGELVDKTLIGHTPVAMSADDRALLDVASVICATAGGLPLAASKQRSIVEDALARAIGGGGASASTTSESPAANIVPLAGRGRRRFVPWVIAGASTLVAAAAIVVLVVRGPRIVHDGGVARVPTEQRSRPTDALIGPIARAHAGDADVRIDTIFADRLDGFRDRTLEGHKP
jgi:hypothetical protein